jgi:protein TonB
VIVYLAFTPSRTVRYTDAPQSSGSQVHFATLPPVRMSFALTLSSHATEPSSAPPVQRKLAHFDMALPPVSSPVRDAGDLQAVDHAVDMQFTDVFLHVAEEPAEHLVFPEYTFETDEVELGAVAAPENPKPTYPPLMVRRGVEAKFAVVFVVDTSGRIDRETLELPRVPHAEFTEAVRDVLEKWHFVPAELGGRRVRERVRQRFAFRIVP